MTLEAEEARVFSLSIADVPDVLVSLNINFVEHCVLRLVGYVGLHFHGDVPGQHAQQELLLKNESQLATAIIVYSCIRCGSVFDARKVSGVIVKRMRDRKGENCVVSSA